MEDGERWLFSDAKETKLITETDLNQIPMRQNQQLSSFQNKMSSHYRSSNVVKK